MVVELGLSGRYSWLQKSQSVVAVAVVEDAFAVAAVAAPPPIDHQLYRLANFPVLAWALS